MSFTRVPISFQMRSEATSTDTFEIKSLPTKPSLTLVIEAISAVNLNSANKVIDVGIVKGTQNLFIRSLTLATAGIYYTTWGPIHVPSDWRVIVNCRSPNDGDMYIVNVFGYLLIPC